MPRITRGVRAWLCLLFVPRGSPVWRGSERLYFNLFVSRKTPQGPSLWPIGAQGAGCGARITSKLSRARPPVESRVAKPPCETRTERTGLCLFTPRSRPARCAALALHQAHWSIVRLPSETLRRPEVSIEMSTGGAALRTASLPAPGACGGGASGRLRGQLGGLELSLRMLPSLPGFSNLPDSSRPPTAWRMLPIAPGVGGIGGSTCPSRSDIAGRPVSVSVSVSVSSSRARTTRCPRRKSEPSSSAISEGEPSRGAPAGSPEGPGCPLGSAGGASTAATAALRSSEQSWSAPSAPEARRERSERRSASISNRVCAGTHTHAGSGGHLEPETHP